MTYVKRRCFAKKTKNDFHYCRLVGSFYYFCELNTWRVLDKPQ